MSDLILKCQRVVQLVRQLGPRAAAAMIAQRLRSIVRGPWRRLLLRYRPLSISPAELDRALGGLPAHAALRTAARALPSVTRWCERLDAIEADARAQLLARADLVVDHRFDLLGSGPTDLGSEIDWHRDFKSGRCWPLDHISRIVAVYPDDSDVKVPWELSRAQHLPVLAAAYRVSGRAIYLDELGAQLEHWIATNPVEFGVNWACTMDVAIRAVNWLAALVVVGEAAIAAPWSDDVLGSLLLHCRFIRGHLEDGPARGNHYLSDVVGLLCASSLFSASPEGRGWARWAASELGREMQHEVRADGVCHEMSLAYHRLVTELFVVGADAAKALAPDALDPSVPAGIERMLQFVSDYTRDDGLAPQIGDVDNGRLLPLDDYGADQREHLHVFVQAGATRQPTTGSVAYPDGGFYLLRARDLLVAVRCGDVGIHGRGCHAHNDLLGFELSAGERTLVPDPGSYLYTADLAQRNAFRSTAVHSTLQIDGAEQNEIRQDRPFAVRDRARPEVVRWDPDGPTLIARHHGFEELPVPATHTRTLALDGEHSRLEITDVVRSAGAHRLSWTFPIDADELELVTDGAIARCGELSLQIVAPGLMASVIPAWVSEAYGDRRPISALRLSGVSAPGEHAVCVRLSVGVLTPAAEQRYDGWASQKGDE